MLRSRKVREPDVGLVLLLLLLPLKPLGLDPGHFTRFHALVVLPGGRRRFAFFLVFLFPLCLAFPRLPGKARGGDDDNDDDASADRGCEARTARFREMGGKRHVPRHVPR